MLANSPAAAAETCFTFWLFLVSAAAEKHLYEFYLDFLGLVIDRFRSRKNNAKL